MKNRPNLGTLANRDEDILLATVGDLHRDAGVVDEACGLKLGDHPADGSLALGASGEFLDLGVDSVDIANQFARAVGVGRCV